MYTKTVANHARIQSGGHNGFGPPENLINIGFLSNTVFTGPDPLKDHKATKATFNFGPSFARQRNAFTWRFAGGLVMAC